MAPTTALANADETVSLSGDRPDFTDGTDTVAKGHGQVEAGVEYGFESNTTRLPDALVRLGLNDGLELRIATPSVVLGSTGSNPIEFGVPPSIMPATDTAQLLGLIVAQRH